MKNYQLILLGAVLLILCQFNQLIAQNAYVNIPDEIYIGNLKVIITPEAKEVIQDDARKLKPHIDSLIIERWGIYLPIVESAFVKNKIPKELKYLAIAETKYLHDAEVNTPVFYFQGRDDVAKKNLLNINHKVDDRKHIYLTSAAVAKSIQKNNYIVQNWLLAALAFQLEKSVKDLLTDSQKIAFDYEVKLGTPQEIYKYLTYRFLFEQMKSEPAVSLQMMEVPAYQTINLKKIACQHNCKLKDLQTYNSWLLRRKVSLSDDYIIFIPQKNVISKEPIAENNTSKEKSASKITGNNISIQSIAQNNKTTQKDAPIVLINPTTTAEKPASPNIKDLPINKSEVQKQDFDVIVLESTTTEESIKASTTTKDEEKDSEIELLEVGKNKIENHSIPAQKIEQPIENFQETILPTTPSQKTTQHKVMAGDNLFKIAIRYGITIQNLRAWNNFAPTASQIYVGQELNITPPNNSETIEPNNFPTKYKVVSGDNLYSISKRYSIKLEKLLELNNLSYDQTIQVGQILVLSEEKIITPKYQSEHKFNLQTGTNDYPAYKKSIKNNFIKNLTDNKETANPSREERRKIILRNFQPKQDLNNIERK